MCFRKVIKYIVSCLFISLLSTCQYLQRSLPLLSAFMDTHCFPFNTSSHPIVEGNQIWLGIIYSW